MKCKVLSRFAPPDLSFPLFLRLSGAAASFSAIGLLIRAVTLISRSFDALAAFGRPPELRDAAVSAFISLCGRSHALLEQSQTRSRELLDVRESHCVSADLSLALSSLLGLVFAHFGDSSPLPWREHVPLVPAELSLPVWGAYFRLVEQSDDILRFLCESLRAHDVDGALRLTLRSSALREVALVCAARAPIAAAAVARIAAEIRDVVRDAPAGSYTRFLCGLALPLVMCVYADRYDGGEAVGDVVECWSAPRPFAFPEWLPVGLFVQSIVHVLEHYWRDIAAARMDVVRIMVAAVALWGDKIDPDSRQCARRFLRGAFQDIAEIGMSAELLRKIEPLVAA
jgi:hypothetical protein